MEYRKKGKWSFIKDPIFGYINISYDEKKIIDTEPVQRLRRVRQLAGSEYVYPAGVHTRFEHSLGTMYLAEELTNSLAQKVEIDPIEKSMVKIASLLHDVGHGPFSHIFEALLIRHLEKTHEDFTTWIIKNSELGDVLNNLGLNSDKIAKLAVGKLRQKNRWFLDQIIVSAVDVDKCDYCIRDSYHTGGDFDSIDIFRLIYTMDILNDNLAVNLNSISTLETFLIARLELFKTIYFHKASRAVQIMLETAMEKANEELSFMKFDSVEEYIKLDDYTMWSMLDQCKASREIINRLKRRELLKVSYERISFAKDEAFSTIVTKDKVRQQIAEEIADEAGVDKDKVYIDVPTLPSVPYYHSISLEPMEIPIFQVTRQGEKVQRNLSEVSNIVEVMKGFLNIIRVYTNREHREAVAKATESVLGPPYSAKISY
ncbi:MAG: HD domain-containing protein [Candidatus Freyarchaeota archaeon]|nr:HD domain-containing protein [Candidatus Jordarchaeia archaeon]MBS7269671.1 HD domain-containing protein [Candidatus Jordarchaeia archaeon]MBS7279699.1 HD domain-containing protein [Candidatus Jordarchaeia archaeon]